MPNLDIEIVSSDTPPDLPANLAQSLADKFSSVFDEPDGTVRFKIGLSRPRSMVKVDMYLKAFNPSV